MHVTKFAIARSGLLCLCTGKEKMLYIVTTLADKYPEQQW